MRPRSPSTLAALVALAAACGGPSASSGPTPALSRTVFVQDEFHKLLAAWTQGSRVDRIALAPKMADFRNKHPTDGLARLAGALEAWGEMEAGSLERAESLAKKVQTEGAGTTADLARAVEGAIHRRHGNPLAALSILEPLVSKLLDAYARDFLNEEIVMSALAANKNRRALELMETWLRETNADDQSAIGRRIDSLLAGVPPSEMAWLLDQPVKQQKEASEVSMRKLVAMRLAGIAEQTRDVKLAQRLLASSSDLLGSEGPPIAALAAGASRARVEARTVGLLLSLRPVTDIQQHGAEVAAGVANGLGLPASAARLVSRDDGGSTERIADALGSLASDGASIVIAGLDPAGSAAAARFCEDNKLPAILLAPPSAKGAIADPKFTFVLGEDPTHLEQMLVAALAARGAKPLALLSVLGAPPPPEADESHVCGETFSPKGKVAGVVIGPTSACARALGGLTVLPKARLGAAFDTFGIVLSPGSVMTAAGLFPVDEDDPPPAMKAWVQARHATPTFWSALGHDAAVLAYAAVQGLAEKGTEDPKEVLERRTAAAAALASAKGALWTTEAKGFAGAHTMARTIEVREIKSDAR